LIETLNNQNDGGTLVKKFPAKLNNTLHNHYAPCEAMFFLHCRNDTKWHSNIISDAVPHEFKLAVRRDKRNRAIGVKLSETNTSVERAVINLYTGLARGSRFLLNHQLVIQAEFAFRHASQLGIHLHLARHFVP
jgi:hypothetical protein